MHYKPERENMMVAHTLSTLTHSRLDTLRPDKYILTHCGSMCDYEVLLNL